MARDPGPAIRWACGALSGQAAQTAWAVYLNKYPFIQKNKLLKLMLNTVTFYKIVPSWIRLIDNTQGFGHKEELRMSFS